MKFRVNLARFIIGALYFVGAAAMLLMMALVVSNSLGRVFFNSPIKMTIEGSGLLGVILISIAIGFAERKRINIFVGVLFDRFSERTRLILESFTLLLCMVAAAYFCWAAFGAAFDSYSMQEHTIALQIPLVPLRFIWAAGILILCIYLAEHLIQDIIKVIKK